MATTKQLIRSYLNFDLDLSTTNEGYLARVLDSPQGEGSTQFTLDFSEHQLENSLVLIGGQVRKAEPSRYSDNGQSDAPLLPRDPRSFGRSLFENVFAGEVGDLFTRSLDEAKRRKAGLRVRLRVNHAPELAALPWEYLYDPHRRRYLCRSVQTPLVRYLEMPEKQEPLQAELPLRILVVLSDPVDILPKLDVEAEWERLKSAFARLEATKRVKLERLEDATVTELRRIFRQGKDVHILHFIGHGGFDYEQNSGGLILEDQAGKGVFVSAETLCDILGDRPPRLVFLNACEGAKTSLLELFSGAGQQLVQQGTPAVIAMQFMISDNVAVNLAQEFYTALAEGNPVDAALAEARKAVSAEGSLMEWGTPVLFMRSPDGYPFDVKAWLPTPPCPYPGMAPFGQANSDSDPFIDKFYGRAQEIDEAIHKLRNDPFLAVIGPSGVGKSSLVFAGILPRLAQTASSNDEQWIVKSMRPGETPLSTLSETLGLSFADLKEKRAPIARTDRSKLLLVIDQFEELFTLCQGQEAIDFQDVLDQLLQSSGFYIVLTVRADFYRELQGSPLWERIKAHRLELKPLGASGLREAIVKPAHDVDVEIDPALVERLLADAVDEPGAMSLLQETLVLLWDKVHRRYLALKEYTHLTHKYVGRTGIQVALAQRADTTYGELPTPAQLLARRTLLRLVQFGEGRPDTRRQQTFSALQVGNDDLVLLNQTVQGLTISRLLTITGEESDQDRKVDIAHEALIIGWPTFQSWLGEWRQSEQTRRSFEAKATQWREHGRQGALLNELLTKEAKAWIVSPQAQELGCSQELRKLTAASRRALLVQKVILWLSVAATLSVLFMTLRTIAIVDEGNRIESRRVAKSVMQQLLNETMPALGSALTRLPTRANPLPVVPEIQSAVFQALHTPLEDTYQDLSTLLPADSTLTAKQIQPNRDWLAIGGTQVALFELTSNKLLTLTTPSEPYTAIQWDPTGTRFIGWSAHQISAWQGETALGEQSLKDEAIGCAQWRPASAMSNEVAFCSDTTVRLWSPNEQTVSKLAALPVPVAGLSWSPDGRWLVAWDDSRAFDAETQSIFIWDSRQQYALVTTTLEGANPIQNVAWSANNRYFIAPQWRRGALLWDTEAVRDGVRIGPPGRIDGIAFVDEESFLSWAANDVTRLWSVTGEQTMQYGIAEDRVQAITFVPQQRAFLTFLSSGAAYQWDIDSGERIHTFCCHDKPILSANWRDSRYLATAGKDGTARIWQIEEFQSAGKELVSLHVSKANNESGRVDVLGTLWLNGRDLLAYGQDGAVRRWQIFDEEDQPLCAGVDTRVLPICHHFTHTISDIQGSRQLHWLDHATLLAADNTSASTITIGSSTSETHTVATSQPPLWSLDGSYLLRIDGEQAGQVEETMSGRVILTLSQTISDVLALPESFLVTGNDGTITLVQPRKNQTTLLQGALYPVTAAALAQDGQLATATKLGVIQIWSLPEGSERTRLGSDLSFEQQSPIRELRWSIDRKALFSASRKVVRWNLSDQTGTQLLNNVSLNASIDLSNDGRWLAVAMGTHFFVIDAKSDPREPLWENREHDQPVEGVRWIEAATWPNQYRFGTWLSRLGGWLIGQNSVEGSKTLLLMTWSGDGTVRLWDCQQRAEVLRLTETGPIQMAELSPNGSYIATSALTPSGDPGPLRIWQTWVDSPTSLRETAQKRLIAE